MTKKEMERKINNLNFAVAGLQNEVWEKRDVLTITQAKKRDYIVRTNNLGKITHKQIKDDFKKEIEELCGDKFDSITNKLLNYEFYFENKNILELFSETLKKYEYKQLVIDTYGAKA